MAAGAIAEPGTALGPCADDCQHTDCAANRRSASTFCAICERPIGYDTPFYRTEVRGVDGEDVSHDAAGKAYTLTHAVCLESEGRS